MPLLPRLGTAGVACAAVVAIAAPALHAHAVVQPAESRPADLQQYTLTVPNEEDSAVVEVAMQVPAGITFLVVEEAPGWRTRVTRRNDRIAELRWSGGRVPPDHYASFRFIARNPVEQGTIAWPTVQRYRDGHVARWIGPAGSEEPASRTRIAEDATPTDVIDVVGGSAASGEPVAGDPPGTDPAAAEDDSGRDALTLAVAILAALLGAAALGVALAARRRSPVR